MISRSVQIDIDRLLGRIVELDAIYGLGIREKNAVFSTFT